METSFPATRINRLRSRAAEVWQVSEGLPEGWSRSRIDPAAVVAVFKVLRVKPGYVLRAYQFHQGGNGNGIVWAMPAKAPFPDPNTCPRLGGHFLAPPKPPGAFEDFMDAIGGDDSPWSYLCASVLKRELEEFGAMWHGCNWRTHTILGNSPFGPKSRHGTLFEHPVSRLEEWHWSRSLPSKWRPRVEQLEGGEIVVRFLTLTALGGEQLVFHEDHYRAGSYLCRSDDIVLGRGPGGFVF